jgi:hypothetical protein
MRKNMLKKNKKKIETNDAIINPFDNDVIGVEPYEFDYE